MSMCKTNVRELHTVTLHKLRGFVAKNPSVTSVFSVVISIVGDPAGRPYQF